MNTSKRGTNRLKWVFLLFLPQMITAAALAPKQYELQFEGIDLVLPCQLSHSLTHPQAAVKRVIISIHGANYSAQEAYNAVVIANGGHQGEADPVCIIAPQFLRSSEVPTGIPDNLLYWNNFPFRGTSSARYGPTEQRVSVSVFDVVDDMLATIADGGLFPNLETVVVAGFSAGGQLVNRYAVAGRFEGTLPAERNLHIRYMVMSPSSYVYFSPARDPDGDGTFSTPDNSCTGYNDWGYGMWSLFSYPAVTGLSTMMSQYPKRFVFYLVGSADNDPNDPSLATDCAANLQGAHRVARAETYFIHLLNTFGADILDYQAIDIVPGAGHSFYSMLNSTAGRRYLLDTDLADADGDGQTDWGEWIAGTNPEDPADRFRLSWNVAGGAGEQGISWPMLPGRNYQILGSDTPGGTFSEESMVSADGSEETGNWPVAIGTETRFYQVQAGLD